MPDAVSFHSLSLKPVSAYSSAISTCRAVRWLVMVALALYALGAHARDLIYVQYIYIYIHVFLQSIYAYTVVLAIKKMLRTLRSLFGEIPVVNSVTDM